MKIASLCLGLLLLSSSTSFAEDPGLRDPGLSQPAPPNACGHTAELKEAKRALAEGDREGAIHHLQRAQQLVAACQRNAVDPEREEAPMTPASAFAQAPRADRAGPSTELARPHQTRS